VLTRGAALHPGLFERLAATAEAAGIAVQIEAMHITESTWTDVDGALDALTGSAAALVSIPLRHMHTPGEVCALSDLDETAELIARFIETVDPEDTWER
jgi:endoglucanase